MDPDFGALHYCLRDLLSSRIASQRQSEILSTEFAGACLSFTAARPLWALWGYLLCQYRGANGPQAESLLFLRAKGQDFLKGAAMPQRYIGADVLDQLVWEEVSTRLQDPDLVLEAHRECRAHSMDREEASSSEQMQKLASQIKLAHTEQTRLLDAYQAGAMELAELQKRRRLVDAKLDTLSREKELLEKMAREQNQESHVRRDLEGFAALVMDRLQHFSFGEKQ